jgi:UDP-N-acetylmuramoyl-tripeptide--D-alanyl-D-alanine ligase
MLEPYLLDNAETYSIKEVMEWKISDVLVSVKNTQFKMKKGKKELSIESSLLGRHQVAPLALVVAISDALGLTKKEIEQGCKKIQPYEHRMQPRFVHGAWLIDDTYNGNLEGLKAGLKLLGELDMKRKWYVTPGLVDQGTETRRVHVELGETIASINPDIVVLMDNSVRPIIEESIKANGFSGELKIERNPLDFYTNIEYIVAEGDLVLMQNDWTDNYN